MDQLKEYHDLNDVEKNIIREYASWKQSACDPAYKITMLQYWRKRAREARIEHLL